MALAGGSIRSGTMLNIDFGEERKELNTCGILPWKKIAQNMKVRCFCWFEKLILLRVEWGLATNLQKKPCFFEFEPKKWIFMFRVVAKSVGESFLFKALIILFPDFPPNIRFLAEIFERMVLHKFSSYASDFWIRSKLKQYTFHFKSFLPHFCKFFAPDMLKIKDNSLKNNDFQSIFFIYAHMLFLFCI